MTIRSTRALAKALAAAALAGASLGAWAQAAAPIKFAMCYDISKAYTFVSPQVIQAAKDYADIVNLQGGIEGRRVEIVVEDHGNEPQRGIECYEKLKREGVVAFDFLSTPVSRAVLPRAMTDGNIVLQSFVGRGNLQDLRRPVTEGHTQSGGQQDGEEQRPEKRLGFTNELADAYQRQLRERMVAPGAGAGLRGRVVVNAGRHRAWSDC